MKPEEIIKRIRQAYDAIYEKYEGNSLIEGGEKIRKYLMDYVESAGVGHSLFDSVNTRENILGWLEKQGNLIKALQISNARIGELIVENYYLKESLEKQGEQKPTWSEEDEIVLNNLIYALANDRIGNNRDEYVDWLKSLKQRIDKL